MSAPAPVPPADSFVAELDRLRRRAAHGTGRTRVSLEQLAEATGIPRSTVHSYVRGQRLPAADVLDRIVVALGATAAEQAEWAERLERLVDEPPTTPPRDVVRPPLRVPRMLPAAPAGFVGRDAELARITEVVDAHDPDGAAPLVLCLTGTGGVGKTALALSWAHANAARFPDGQLWVDLRGYSAAPPQDPSDVLERLLRAVGVDTTELTADLDERAELFRSAVAGSRLLIVLDNARHVPQVQPLLAGASGTVTIVTSRESMRALAVSVGATRVPVDRLPDADATDLLTAQLPPQIAADVRESGLAARCDGLPLALRIVRELLDATAPTDIARFTAEHAGDSARLLESLDLPDAAVDLSVRSAFDWSYRALSPDAARLFRLLPLCFSATFDADLVEAVLGADAATTRRLLAQLVSANLLDRAGRGFVRLHDLVAGYANERLLAQESETEQAAIRLRLWNHLLDRCEQAFEFSSDTVPWRLARPGTREPGTPFPDEAAATTWVADHADVFVPVIQDALARGEVDYAGLLTERAWRVMFAKGSVSRIQPVLAAVAAAAEENGDVHVALVMLRTMGVGYGRAIRFADAAAAFQRAVELAEAHAPRFDTDARMSAANLALVWAFQGQVRRAIDVVRRRLDGTPAGVDIGWYLLTLVQFNLQVGDLDAAEHYMRRFDSERAEFPGWRSEYYERPVNLAIARGDWAAARRHLDGFATAEIKIGDDIGRHVGLLTLAARVDAAQGLLARAEETIEESVAHARRIGSRSRELAAVGVLGEVLTLTGRAEDAAARLAAELGSCRELGLRYLECQLLSVLARALASAGRPDEADAAARQAAAIAAECGYEVLAREIAGDMPDPVSRSFLSG